MTKELTVHGGRAVSRGWSLSYSQLLLIGWDLEGVSIKVTGDTIFWSVNI